MSKFWDRKGRAAKRRQSGKSRLAAPAASRRLAFEQLEGRRLLATTTVGVLAAGTTGTEALRLLIDGAVVANWTNTRVYNSSTRVFDALTYTYNGDLTAERVRVQFVNDGAGPGGVNRDLRIDGITLNGAKYETEASSVYSTGVYDAATRGPLVGYRQNETLHSNGYFQFGGRGSTIQVLAAGQTGTEQMVLFVGNLPVATYNNVAGNYATGQFVTFTYNGAKAASINQIRVVFANDGPTATGADRNLRVDGVLLDGAKYETEAATVYTNGMYVAPQGRSFGWFRSEYLPLSGYFQYGSAGSVVEVLAAGQTGSERMELNVGGATAGFYQGVGGNYATGAFAGYVFTLPNKTNLNQLQVAFVNDGLTATGADRNLRVDQLLLDGVSRQAEALDVYSTGTYVNDVGVRPGYWQSEYLHANGSFQFAKPGTPGTLALGAALATVDEFTASVSIPVVRTGGTDGTVGLRYTTVSATATAGSDFTAASGVVIFAPGETAKSIVVPILNDTLREANETFNIAVDQAIGGASTGVPRTATITIVDDELPPTPGSGNGLLGQYYNDQNLLEYVYERTDPTVAFDWGSGSPAGAIGADTFSARWLGKIEPLYSETYTFHVTSDDGVRLWVDNKLIVNSWQDQNTVLTGQIALLRGRKYDIRMEYFENAGQARAILGWSSASQPQVVVPQSQLYSDPPAPTEVGRFSGQLIATGLSGPTAMDIDSTQRIFIAEQRGVVRVYQNAQLLPTPFLDIQSRVNYFQDRGMIGITLHPNFPATPYVYVSYTYDPAETLTRTGNAGPDGGGNRVARISRFTADAATGYNTAVAGSEVVLVGTNSTWANISHPELDSTDDMNLAPSGGNNGNGDNILIADSRSHTIGAVGFGPDGMLYAANGDGASYGRVDARAARVQSLDSLSGKILRIDPITGAGLADNPFYNGNVNSNRSKVYDYGLRNPFRFAFHPTSQQLYIGDVGWVTWEELDVGRGKNFGWPWYEGGDGQNLRTGDYQALPAAQAFYATNPVVTPPLWSRTHASGAAAIVAGDFYTGTNYPQSYRNALFISDVNDQQLRVVRLNADGSLNSVAPLNLSVGFVTEMSMGRDGYMYYSDIVGGTVGRLVFTPGASVAAATSETVATNNAPPQIGDFDGSGDVDGADILAWQRNQGTIDASLARRPGDADYNGAIDERDLALTRARFGPDAFTAATNALGGNVTLKAASSGDQAAVDAVYESLGASRGRKLRWRR